ncbi:MAG: GNAT family N-acetyltransferase [Acidovorax sp.]|uniref:GNAT family N-acetyltransferase n=1 Tax=Acidovorax sp. TaxID=1872122 RepID=UPI0039193675
MSSPVALRKIGLRFLVGEWAVGMWYPCLAVVEHSDLGSVASLQTPASYELLLSAGAAGVLCRRIQADHFNVGIGRYGRWLRYVRSRDVHHFIEIQPSWEAYFSQFTGKSRQNLRRSVKRFAERQQGGGGVELLTTPDDMPRFHREALRISEETYQHKLLKSGLPAGKAFVAHLEKMATEGRARGYLLRDGGRPIAYAWCSLAGDVFKYEIVGYLPDSADLSPGTVLLYHIIEDAHAIAGCRLLDFGPGEALYKSMFANRKVEYVDLYLFRMTVVNVLLVGLHRGLTLANEGLGRFLEKLGVKSRIKRFMRAMS